MKLLKLLFIAFVIAGIGFLAFDFIRPSYPVTKSLENLEGRSTNFLIQGKENGIVFVDRVPGGERFEIPIENLSLKDRIFCSFLRESPAPKIVANVEDTYVTTRRKALVELRKKEKVIRDEINSNTLNDLLHQNRIEQLNRVGEEIRELELAIKTYDYRMKK
ncbi:MAG: hypothetical protein P1U58_12420 [Verrucomicrobiales bacterium]|nr:hypothetical protein [Verrucomicrobiales bacterium]